MTPSKDLFDLIKSLDAREKKILTTCFSSAGQEQNIYGKLFRAIERQTEYNEQKIKKQLGAVIDAGSFPVIKNRLFHQILDTLRSYSTGDLPDFRIRKMLDKAILLNEKRLKEAAWKLTQKAKQEAMLNELFPEALRALEIERKNILFQKAELYEKLLEENSREENSMVDKHTNLKGYEDLQSRMFGIFRTNLTVRNEQDSAFFRQMLDHPLLLDSSAALSFRAKYHFYFIKSACHRYLGDSENAYSSIQKLLRLIESEPMLHYRLRMYIYVLPDMAVIQASLGKFDEALKSIRKIRTVREAYSHLAKNIPPGSIFRITAITETDMYIRIPDYDNGAAQLPRIEAEIKKYRSWLPRISQYILYYNIGLIYFGAGNHRQALHWFNVILDENKDEYTLDTICSCRILFLIVHLEMGHEDLLEYAAQSTLRYLTTRKRKYKVESVFLDLLQHILNPGKKQDLKGIYRGILEQFNKLKEDPYEKGAFEHFDFISWCESKVQNCTFAEIIRRKNKNK